MKLKNKHDLSLFQVNVSSLQKPFEVLTQSYLNFTESCIMKSKKIDAATIGEFRVKKNKSPINHVNFKKTLLKIEAVAQRCSVKKVFLKTWQTPVPESLFK